MEIVNIGNKDGKCMKCHGNLSQEEKGRNLPICTKCITELKNIVKGSIDIDSLEEYSDDVSNFTDFVRSSAKLMGLGDVVIVQVCHNIFMDMVRGLGKKDRSMAKKIFNDTKRFIDEELEKLGAQGADDLNKSGDFGHKDFFEKMMSNIHKIMKDHENLKNIDDKSGDCNNNIDKDNCENDKKERESSVKRRRIKVD
jgi:hypothetical protein